MKLYEISQQMLDAMTDLSARYEAGEISEDVLADTMEGLEGQWDEKALAVAKFVVSIEAEADAVESAEKRMARRRKSLRSSAEWFRKYLLRNAAATNRWPSDAEIAIRSGTSEAVIIDDDAALPLAYKTHIPEEWEPDRVAIKAAIKAGEEVLGAHIEIRQHLVIK